MFVYSQHLKLSVEHGFEEFEVLSPERSEDLTILYYNNQNTTES